MGDASTSGGEPAATPEGTSAVPLTVGSDVGAVTNCDPEYTGSNLLVGASQGRITPAAGQGVPQVAPTSFTPRAYAWW